MGSVDMLVWTMRPPANVPRNVRIFAGLWAGSTLIALPDLFFLPSPAKFGVATKSAELAICGALIIISSAIILPVFWLVVWGRRGWARWLLLFLFVGLSLLILDYPYQFDPDEM